MGRSYVIFLSSNGRRLDTEAECPMDRYLHYLKPEKCSDKDEETWPNSLKVSSNSIDSGTRWLILDELCAGKVAFLKPSPDVVEM